MMNAFYSNIKTRPLIGVVYDLGSASLATIRAAAGRDFEIVFICDQAISHVAEYFDQAMQYARVLDITDRSEVEILIAIRELKLSGILTFSEYRLMDVARYSSALGLLGNNKDITHLLTNKFAQRQRLSDLGVQKTICVELGELQSNVDWKTVLVDFPFPAVLKPSSGAGSLNTVRVDSLSQLENELNIQPRDKEYVLESYLAGDSSIAGENWGDYVSVESIHTPNISQQVCVTGKFPLSPPFRETGMVLPCTLDDSVINEVLQLEASAIKALGVNSGITHTEIKLTALGPRIIEVNGRLGGYVPEILKRASGINLVKYALELSVGRELQIPNVEFNGVHYQYFLTPPELTQGALLEVNGLDYIAEGNGVLQVEMQVNVGDWVDYQKGTQSLLGIIYGEADSHQNLQENIASIKKSFRPEFSQSN